MEITQTSLQDIRDARRNLAASLNCLDRMLDSIDPEPGTPTRAAIAKQAQIVEDNANNMKHVARRFEEGI